MGLNAGEGVQLNIKSIPSNKNDTNFSHWFESLFSLRKKIYMQAAEPQNIFTLNSEYRFHVKSLKT